MSAKYDYEGALRKLDAYSEVGLKASVEAINDGDHDAAVELLRATARCIETEAALDSD